MKISITNDEGNEVFSGLSGHASSPSGMLAACIEALTDLSRDLLSGAHDQPAPQTGGEEPLAVNSIDEREAIKILKLFIGNGGGGVDTVYFDRTNPRGINVRVFDLLVAQSVIYPIMKDTFSLTTTGVSIILPLLGPVKAPDVTVNEGLSWTEISADYPLEGMASAVSDAFITLNTLFRDASYARLSNGSKAIIFDVPKPLCSLPKHECPRCAT